MTKHTFGASSSDLSDVSLGALRTVAGSDKRAQQALALANELTPQIEFDPYLAALQFFTQLGAESSKPGATLLGSAASAVPAATNYYANVLEAQKKADQSKLSTALDLASALKPSTTGTTSYKEVEVEDPKTGTKTVTMMNSQEIAQAKKEGKLVRSAPSTTTKSFTKRTLYKGDQKKDVYTLDDYNKAIALGWSTVSDIKSSSEKSFTKRTLYKDGIQKDVYSKDEYDTAIADDWSTERKIKTGGGTSQFERFFAAVNDIGNRLADPNLKDSVTQLEKNQYSAYFQKLTEGGEFTETVDGVTTTITRPGIDLAGTTNLPIPEDLDLEKVLNTKKQKFDQNQNTSATFGSRMLFNEGILRNVLADGYVLTLEDIAGIRARKILGLGNLGVGTQAQQFHVAAQNWVAAQLRNESGAAIAPSEYADALEQYFPKVGDSRETILQKQALREEATRGMINSAGDAFNVIFPDAVQYLTFTSGDQTYKILNPQGYANEKLAKTDLGRDLLFKETIKSKTLTDLKNMLANPNAANLYSDEMLDAIAEEIRKRNSEQN